MEKAGFFCGKYQRIHHHHEENRGIRMVKKKSTTSNSHEVQGGCKVNGTSQGCEKGKGPGESGRKRRSIPKTIQWGKIGGVGVKVTKETAQLSFPKVWGEAV